MVLCLANIMIVVLKSHVRLFMYTSTLKPLPACSLSKAIAILLIGACGVIIYGCLLGYKKRTGGPSML